MAGSAQVRLSWLDRSKGLGILLVVAGHVLSSSAIDLSLSISKVIYLFHMPLFFFIAGYTLKEERLGSFVKRKCIALLIPYTIFLVLVGLPAIAVSCALGPVPAFGIGRCTTLPFRLLASGTSVGGIFGVFWFIPCLLLASVAVQAALPFLRRMKATPKVLCGILFYAMALALPLVLPVSTAVLSLGIVPMAAVYVYFGHVYRQDGMPLGMVSICVVSVVVFSLAYFLPADFDMKQGIFGMPLIGLFISLTLVSAVILFSHQLEKLPWLASSVAFLGTQSLVIMYLHQTIHFTLRHIGVQNHVVLVAISLLAPLLFIRPVSILIDILTDRLQASAGAQRKRA